MGELRYFLGRYSLVSYGNIGNAFALCDLANRANITVLIEFFIKYQDLMGVGDKLTFFTALKSIIGEVIPEGYEPKSFYRPTEEVSSFIAPGAVLK